MPRPSGQSSAFIYERALHRRCVLPAQSHRALDRGHCVTGAVGWGMQRSARSADRKRGPGALGDGGGLQMPVHHTAGTDGWENGTHRPNPVRRYPRGQRQRILRSPPSPCFPISHLTRTTRAVPVSHFLRSARGHMCPLPTTRGEQWYKLGHSPNLTPVTSPAMEGEHGGSPHTNPFPTPASTAHSHGTQGWWPVVQSHQGGWCHPDHKTPNWLQSYPWGDE